MTAEDALNALPAERREAVRVWLATSIGDCTACGRSVLLTDPRAAGEGGFHHLDCVAVAAAGTGS